MLDNHDLLSRIAMNARPETRLFMIAVARALHHRYGSEIILYTGTAQEAEFYAKNGKGVFKAIVQAPKVQTAAMESTLTEAEEVARALVWEKKFGQTYNSLSVANRHLGRGYALGGYHHPRSRMSNQASYSNLVHAYNRVLEFWDREFRENDFTLVMNGSREMAVVARHYSLPFRVIAGSRFMNYYNWAWNEFYENPQFEAAYRVSATAKEIEFDQPYHAHLVNRERFVRNVSLWKTMVSIAHQIARYMWWNFRGYQKAKGYYLTENIAMIMRVWSDWRRLRQIANVTLSDLKGQKFVYYPLHQEPETALQGLSPEYFYQLSSIAAVARDLPAGVKLAVKETFGAVGRRPRNFYEQIAEFKNVVMLAPLEYGLDCVRQADVTITITGTAGFEAAVLGKPVITFGRHNNYNFLPHVHVVTEESMLPSYLQKCLSGGVDAVSSRSDGARFLQAVVESSFDLRGYDFIKVEQFDPQAVEEAVTALARSIRDIATKSSSKLAVSG